MFDSLINAFKNCVLLYKGQRDDGTDFTDENSNIISKILSNTNQSRGLILHQGSKILFYIAVILASFAAFLSDEDDGEAILDNLSIGDMVIYANKRGRYLGKDSEGKIMIKTDCMNYVPVSMLYKVKPYKGNAKALGGKGIKRGINARNRFLASLFGMKQNEIKSSIRCSFVIVCTKQDAYDFMENLRIGLSTEATFQVGDIFPAAYYTSNDVIHFAGNSAKVDPVIKFTSKVSVARELILQDEKKNIIGLLVCGSDFINSDTSELTSLINRRSLKKIILLGEVFSGDYTSFTEQFENLDFFVWTKKAIQCEITDILSIKDTLCSETKNLYKMLRNCINSDIKVSDIKTPTDKDVYDTCKKALFRISKNAHIGSAKELFVIRGSSLLNLFERACFPISVMEKVISKHMINALSPTEELNNLERTASEFVGELGDDMITVVTSLTMLKEAIFFDNPKYNFLKNTLVYDTKFKENLTIVVPKAYYYEIFKEALPKNLHNIVDQCEFITPSKFDISNLYNDVIAVGIFNWGKLNPLMLSNINSINFMCYPSEKRLYSKLNSICKRQNDIYERVNLIEYNKTIVEPLTYENIHDETDYIYEINVELDSYINNISILNTISAIKSTNMEVTQNTDIVKVGYFETGECIFLTKYYTPYVFDVSNQTVTESEVSLLRSGDMLIFANYDNETKDIVERIIENLVNSEKCDQAFKEAYRKYIHWKVVLKEYIRNHNLTYKELSQRMYDLGRGKHEVTLRTWLDDDSHIVGPRDAESFYAVALLTNDSEMLDNPDSFCEACRQVRSMRMRILKFIGMSIIKAYAKNDGTPDELLSSVAGDVTKMSRVLQIDKIADADRLSIPAYLANKPHVI